MSAPQTQSVNQAKFSAEMVALADLSQADPDASVLFKERTGFTPQDFQHRVVDALSAEFTLVICEYLTTEQMESVRSLNAQRNDPHSCATHDFCDANMAMEEAWNKVMTAPVDAGNEAQASLWGKAWSLSAAGGFKAQEYDGGDAQREYEEMLALEPQIAWQGKDWHMDMDGVTESKSCVTKFDGRYQHAEMISVGGGEPSIFPKGVERDTLEEAVQDVNGGARKEVVDMAEKLLVQGNVENRTAFSQQQGGQMTQQQLLQLCELQRAQIEVMQAKISDLMVGINIIEVAHQKASSGDLSNAPFPLVGDDARIYLQAQESALGHALDMLNASELNRFISSGYGKPESTHEQDDSPSPGM